MNLKALFAFIALLIVGVFGVNQYLSSKHEKELAAMKAETEKTQAEVARMDAEKAMMQKEVMLAQMPESAKQVLIEREKEQKLSASTTKPEIEIKSENVEIAKELKRLYAQWKDGEQLAGRSARIALANPVKNLQDIKRTTQELKVTDCLAPYQANLVGGMDETVKGYLDFMQYEGEIANALAYAAQEKAKPMFDKFEKGIDTCK